LENRQGRIWIGTNNNGLNILKYDLAQPPKCYFTRYVHNHKDESSITSGAILSLLEDKSGKLWIGIENGGLNLIDLNSFHEDKVVFHHYHFNPLDINSLSNNSIYSLYEDRDGGIWIGTHADGINYYHALKEKFVHIKQEPNNLNSLSSIFVNVFYEEGDLLWIGTNYGLNVFNRSDNNFDCYAKEHGLPNNQVKGILEDAQGNLWISSNRGLSQFIQGTKRPEKAVFKNYDVRDGLQGNEFTLRSCWRGQDGKMYFGGKNGFNVFHPDSIKENAQKPFIAITNFLLFNKDVRIGTKDSPLTKHIILTKNITLSYKHSVITFEYTALNLITPEKNQYAYKLEGFEKDWNYVGNKREATYTNLDPGEYIFHVKGSNNDGIWNEGGASIKIVITPPFW
jgi:hypothetical protein